MARKKNTEEQVAEQEATVESVNLEGAEDQVAEEAAATEQVVATEETVVEEPEKTETKKTKKEKADAGVKAQSEEIPADVLKVLQCFPNEDELYINKFGGVFTKDTEPSVVAGAILYKNPYYKP